jgi:branched-chain amino acid aminotransferase
VFEGVRAYATHRGTAIFRLKPHIRRMFDSAKMYRIEIPYSFERVCAACHEVVSANSLKSAYIRPIVYRGFGSLAPAAGAETPIEVAIAAIEWGAYLGEEALEQGVDVCVSSWARLAPNTMPTMAKAGGNYLSSQLITMEAQRHGYAEGIGLDASGNLSEGGGENLFLVRDGVLHTPPLSSAILPGITRDSVITLARHLGYEVREQVLPREALYVADEAFFTGTAAEISPIRSVDGIVLGAGRRGPITGVLQKAFFGLWSGETEDRWGWLEGV